MRVRVPVLIKDPDVSKYKEVPLAALYPRYSPARYRNATARASEVCRRPPPQGAFDLVRPGTA